MSRARSHWAWGFEDAQPSGDELGTLGVQVGFALGAEAPLVVRDPVAHDDARVAASRLSPPRELAGFVTDARDARLRHTYGRAFPDLLRGFLGDFGAAPDLVALPRDEAEIEASLAWGEREGVVVVPWGGGTSVVGGVEAPRDRLRLALDLAAMDRVLEVDAVSRAARIQAGAKGPALETQLAEHGLSLRHYPQSFEHSTLGGWIATRAGGHYATVYTHIDELVESLRVVTPRGVVETRRLPASGAGPDPERWFLGSEGTLGVITEAWMRVVPRPVHRASAVVEFADFEAAVEGARRVVQARLHPANCRVLDPMEAMLNRVSGDGSAVLLLGFESADVPVTALCEAALGLAAGARGRAPRGVVSRGEGARGGDEKAESWRAAFFRGPYLQGALLRLGVVADTFETACVWSRFPELHARVQSAVRGAFDAEGLRGTLSCRFTHVYPDGPAPYYTYLVGPCPGRELSVWSRVKDAASEALLASGATITHHHAVGRTHRPFHERERPPLFVEMLRAAKREVDPRGILNPGALFSLDGHNRGLQGDAGDANVGRLMRSRPLGFALSVVALATVHVARADEPTAGAPPPPPPGAGAPAHVEEPPPKVVEAPPRDAEPKREKPAAATDKAVRSTDWWTHSRPVFEIHGYFRVRAELFQNFSLGRKDPPGTAMWPRPIDDGYVDTSGNPRSTQKCGALGNAFKECADKTQAGANMRFRLNPELHVSDNLHVYSQIDLLDNVVLGSTPNGYYAEPTAQGFQRGQPSGYAPRAAFANTQEAPTAGLNSVQNSIVVKRAWGEYKTPVGLLRFGRMPSHWGLGILANAGDGYDSDWQSTSDRIMFITGVPSLDLYVGGAWDFPAEGPTSARRYEFQGQPYDLSQLDDVNQWVLVVVRRKDERIAKQDLAAGKAVVNGGAYVVYRNQFLANDAFASDGYAPGAGDDASRRGLSRRSADAWIPDVWLQVRYRKFRFETEAVAVRGSMGNSFETPSGMDYDRAKGAWNIRQYMLATQTELRAVEDKLKIQFGFGWASGDPDQAGLAPTAQQLQPQLGIDRTFSTARFHPDYRVDLILFRNILTRVQGAYYFRPSVEYDFSRNPNGQKFGGNAAVIWSRASEFVQAPGHKRDLGIELDLSLYYQSKDGTLNDDPDKMGGFFTMLQYGVLFPLGGLSYLPGEVSKASVNSNIGSLETSTAHIIRWYTGILF